MGYPVLCPIASVTFAVSKYAPAIGMLVSTHKKRFNVHLKISSSEGYGFRKTYT